MLVLETVHNEAEVKRQKWKIKHIDAESENLQRIVALDTKNTKKNVSGDGNGVIKSYYTYLDNNNSNKLHNMLKDIKDLYNRLYNSRVRCSFVSGQFEVLGDCWQSEALYEENKHAGHTDTYTKSFN